MAQRIRRSPNFAPFGGPGFETALRLFSVFSSSFCFLSDASCEFSFPLSCKLHVSNCGFRVKRGRVNCTLRVRVCLIMREWRELDGGFTWREIFVFKFEQSSHLFSLKYSRPCQDLNPGPPRYHADTIPIELSWLGFRKIVDGKN